MGASQSKSQKKEVICIDCDKITQKDLTASDGLSSEGMPCEEIYKKVEQCMDLHQGQSKFLQLDDDITNLYLLMLTYFVIAILISCTMY